MNINRHNYESFFLMYVDNELSAAEKKQVEIFIQQNPDLQQELSLLQESILKPESIHFAEKKSLFKEEIINDATQQLLMLLDKELNTDEEKQLHLSIKKDSSLRDEWKILQQTKAEADPAIIFENKELLYKNSGRIVAFDWRRIAVAAVLIGFGLWGAVSVFTKRNVADTAGNIIKQQPATPDNSIQQNTSGNVVINKNDIVKDTNFRKLQLETMAQNVARKNSQAYSSVKKDIIVSASLNTNPDDAKSDIDNSTAINFTDNSNKTVMPDVSIQKIDGTVATNNISANNQNDNNLKASSLIDNTTTPVSNPYAAYTASPKDAVDMNNDNQYLYISGKKLKKTKLGSFFSKVRSKTKQGIRIANLEFAIQ